MKADRAEESDKEICEKTGQDQKEDGEREKRNINQFNQGIYSVEDDIRFTGRSIPIM